MGCRSRPTARAPTSLAAPSPPPSAAHRNTGSRTFLLRYADGISVVMNFNSNEAADSADVEAVTNAIHDVAAWNG